MTRGSSCHIVSNPFEISCRKCIFMGTSPLFNKIHMQHLLCMWRDCIHSSTKHICKLTSFNERIIWNHNCQLWSQLACTNCNTPVRSMIMLRNLLDVVYWYHCNVVRKKQKSTCVFRNTATNTAGFGIWDNCCHCPLLQRIWQGDDATGSFPFDYLYFRENVIYF